MGFRTSPNPARTSQGGSQFPQLFCGFREAEPPEPPLSLEVGNEGGKQGPKAKAPPASRKNPGSGRFGGFGQTIPLAPQRLTPNLPRLARGFAAALRGFAPHPSTLAENIS